MYSSWTKPQYCLSSKSYRQFSLPLLALTKWIYSKVLHTLILRTNPISCRMNLFSCWKIVKEFCVDFFGRLLGNWLEVVSSCVMLQTCADLMGAIIKLFTDLQYRPGFLFSTKLRNLFRAPLFALSFVQHWSYPYLSFWSTEVMIEAVRISKCSPDMQTCMSFMKLLVERVDTVPSARVAVEKWTIFADREMAFFISRDWNKFCKNFISLSRRLFLLFFSIIFCLLSPPIPNGVLV